jgi:acyl-CoA hydrolase
MIIMFSVVYGGLTFNISDRCIETTTDFRTSCAIVYDDVNGFGAFFGGIIMNIIDNFFTQ